MNQITTQRKVTAIDVFGNRTLVMYENGDKFGLATKYAIERIKELGAEEIGVFAPVEATNTVRRIAKATGYRLQATELRYDFMLVKA